MSGLHRNYKTDMGLEKEGVEIQFTEAPNDDGSIPTFIVARMGGSNVQYLKALEAATRPHRRRIDMGVMDEETANKILLEVFARHVLLGWKNIQNAEGGDLIYGYKEAIELLTSIPAVYTRLREEASLIANFREEVREAQAKN